MSTIYENSVVTIGALWAKDSSDGLFADRETMCLRNKYGPIGIADPSDSKEPHPSVYAMLQITSRRPLLLPNCISVLGFYNNYNNVF